jgi:hypothetical protein
MVIIYYIAPSGTERLNQYERPWYALVVKLLWLTKNPTLDPSLVIRDQLTTKN